MLCCTGGYGIDLSKIEGMADKTDTLSKKLLEHGVTAFCPTIISIQSGYEKVSVLTTLLLLYAWHWLDLLDHIRSEAKERWISGCRNHRLVDPRHVSIYSSMCTNFQEMYFRRWLTPKIFTFKDHNSRTKLCQQQSP